MGIYDRDYYREPQPRRQWGNFSPVSVTTWLIAINVLVFVIDAFLHHQAMQPYARLSRAAQRYFELTQVGPPPLERWGYFSLTTAITHLQLWRFLTFQFLHANLGHLFANMLGLYFFGPLVESYFGARRYIAFYLFCGSAGAATYLLLLMVGMLQGPDVPLVGASAGIFGVLIAGAMIAPNLTVMLLFPPIPIKFKYLALGLVAYATYVAVTNGPNAGGQTAPEKGSPPIQADSVVLAPEGNATALALNYTNHMVGRDSIVRFLTQEFPKLFVSDVSVEFKGMYADGNTVIVEERMRATLSNGGSYDNDYCFFFTLSGDRISFVREYMDTQRGAKCIFG